MFLDVRAHGLKPGEFENIQIDEAEQIGSILARYARPGTEFIALAIEDEDDDLDVEIIAGQVLKPRSHVHFHHGNLVAVAVQYAGLPAKTKEFRPNKRFKSVFDWAVGRDGFGFTALDASELVLASGPPYERVNVDLHIGDLAGPEKSVKLNLVPLTFFQG